MTANFLSQPECQLVGVTSTALFGIYSDSISAIAGILVGAAYMIVWGLLGSVKKGHPMLRPVFWIVLLLLCLALYLFCRELV